MYFVNWARWKNPLEIHTYSGDVNHIQTRKIWGLGKGLGVRLTSDILLRLRQGVCKILQEKSDSSFDQ